MKKYYYAKFANRSFDLIEANSDKNAKQKALQIAKEDKTDLIYLAVPTEETREDRVLFRK